MAKVPRPIDENWFRREIDDLKKKVEDLSRSRQLGSSTISGELRLSPGSGFSASDADGSGLMRIGQLFYEGVENPPFGVYMSRADGSVAFEVAGADGTRQFVALRDRSGNIIHSDDTASGVGIGRPWLPIPWFNYPTPATTSATFVTTSSAALFKQHPKLDFAMHVSASLADTAGEYRVLVDGQVAYGPVTLAAGTSTFAGDVVAVPGGFGDWMTVDVQVRRTAGTGEVRGTFSHLWARQT